MDIFTEISLIVVIATVVAAIMRLLKQPLIIGYILTGLLVGPYFFNVIHSTDTISTFSQIGIVLLLFIIGLNLSPQVIEEVGKISIIGGLIQIVVTAGLGYLISSFLGFSMIVALYIAVALTFSSTIIILKLLSDKHDLHKLYGKVSVGILLVQDIVAMIALLLVSSFANGIDVINLAVKNIFVGVAMIGILIAFSALVFPRLGSFFARSQEFLFLFSISWGLGVASLVSAFGFSIEIGALAAGVSLSVSPYHLEISSKLRPLRDFFVILFFILLGSQILVDSIYEFIIPALILSLFVILIKPLVVMAIMGIYGYRKKTGFMSGVSLAQISEFSLILLIAGVAVGHISKEILSLVTMVGLITIAISTYLIIYSEKIFALFEGGLTLFERNNVKGEMRRREPYEAVLFGYNHIGQDIIESFKNLDKAYVVIDFDPDVIEKLGNEKIKFKYGDADDNAFLDDLNLKQIKMAASTIPDLETNLLLIDKIKKANKGAIIIMVSNSVEDTQKLYKRGASYVIMPHYISGHHASRIIRKYGFSRGGFNIEKDKHLNYLSRRA